MVSSDELIGTPLGVRYATEFRFRALPRIVDHGGALAAEFSDDTFDIWEINDSPFRVGLRNKSRSKVAAATIRNLQMEMEAPDTFSVFRDHFARWTRLVVTDTYLADQLEVTRFGFRTWFFAPVRISYQDLKRLIYDRFVGASGILDAMEGWRVHEEALVLDLTNEDQNIRMTLVS